MKKELTETYESNPMIERLPKHLKQFIKPQIYSEYTPINQAVWRYVMRKNVNYLTDVAHHSYIDGLRKTGIAIEEIPSMYGMNRILKEIGWAAVAVDGFIPPNAFMEFQAYKVLVIASDIRQLDNIQYTPAPDIIHESAGHAPIIANPDYAEYLRRLGELGAKAILSEHDTALYEAVRTLSILKEAESSTEQEIVAAEQKVEALQNKKVPLSEMAQIRNIQWWTVEYGLIGTKENPKIYGAGLLSSIGESEWCMRKDVKKLDYSIEAAYQDFDITKPQPQLYVTPDFSYLMQVLEQFAKTMAVRNGGYKGLKKLVASGMVGTIELSTGLQISGRFSKAILNEDNEVIYFQTEGSTALAYREKELIGHGIDYHSHGFGSPLGKLKGINLSIEDMGPLDLKSYHFYDGERISFEFESGVKVEGINITGIRAISGKLLLISFKDCTVTHNGETLFRPEYGIYDMAVGKEIISAFAGAADAESFPMLYHESSTKTIKTNRSEKTIALENFYAEIRSIRTQKTIDNNRLKTIFAKLKNNYPTDWLLPLEIMELSTDDTLQKEISAYLITLKTNYPKYDKLITDGMKLLL